jgi:hypothetical protein
LPERAFHRNSPLPSHELHYQQRETGKGPLQQFLTKSAFVL